MSACGRRPLPSSGKELWCMGSVGSLPLLAEGWLSCKRTNRLEERDGPSGGRFLAADGSRVMRLEMYHDRTLLIGRNGQLCD